MRARRALPNTLLWQHRSRQGLLAGRLWGGQYFTMLLVRHGQHGTDSHDLVPESLKQRTLGGLGHEISNHVSSRAPFDRQLSLVNAVSDKEETDVDMFGALAAGSLAILLK